MSTTVDLPTPEGIYTQASFQRPLWKDIALEYFGTFAFVYISIAGVNQVVLSSAGGFVDQLQIAICFTLGLSSGIIIAGKSGGHLNPAVSLTLWATGKDITATRLVGYILAQLCGGFTAGLLVLAVYYSWIDTYSDDKKFIGSFGTLKDSHNSLFASILDQFIGSALLMFGIMATPASWSKPITVGTILGGLGLFQGSNGFAFNLARDMGPRVASAIVFDSDAFSAVDYWVWVPMAVPFFGVPFGWFLFEMLKKIQ